MTLEQLQAESGIKWTTLMAKYPELKGKYTKILQEQRKENEKWGQGLLPRKGSVLRQLVDAELRNLKNKV